MFNKLVTSRSRSSINSDICRPRDLFGPIRITVCRAADNKSRYCERHFTPDVFYFSIPSMSYIINHCEKIFDSLEWNWVDIILPWKSYESQLWGKWQTTFLEDNFQQKHLDDLGWSFCVCHWNALYLGSVQFIRPLLRFEGLV